MRTILATLEEMGLIQRRPHATDGRQVNIELTVKGVGEAKRTWLEQAVAKLDKQEQETLFAAGEIIKRLAEL